MLFHYRMPASGWAFAQVIYGGESFAAFSDGLQNAFIAAQGVPQKLRTDSLSAAYKNESNKDQTSVLFELIAHRYERHSLIITSNKSFEDWDELFDDTTTIAAIDRLVHHATIIHYEGESYRRKAAMQNIK